MANAIITFKLMPVAPEVDYEQIKSAGEAIATKNGAKGAVQGKIEPIAFGLQKVLILAMYEVSDAVDFDAIAAEMKDSIENVSEADVVSMDLAMG